MSLRSKKYGVWLVALAFCGLFVIGTAFHDHWWGIHYLRFLSFENQVTIVLLTVAAFFFPFDLLHSFKTRNGVWWNWLVPIIGCLIYGLLIFAYPTVYDPYGDAVYFHKHFDKIALVNDTVRNNLLGLSLDAWAGQKSVLALVSYASYYLDINQLQAFRLLDLVCGVLFAFLWLRFLIAQLTDLDQILMFALVGTASPFVFIFFGHAEIYAPSLVISLAWCLTVINYFKDRKGSWLIVLLLITLLGIKAHPLAILLMPSVVLMTLSHGWQAFAAKVNRRTVGLFVALPVFMAGTIVYFFVLHDHIDDRSLQKLTMQYDHLFLPIISPAAPLDKYDLLGLNHVFDCLNIVLLWSPALLFLIFVSIIKNKENKPLNHGASLMIALALLFYASLLFVINPILSMPMDWDLFCMPVPFVLVLTVLSAKSWERDATCYVPRAALGFLILSSSFLTLHRSVPSISERLESIGIHVYRTYYEWTAKIISRSYEIVPLTSEEYTTRRLKLINKITPDAREGIDYEFADLISQDAIFLLRITKDYGAAEELLRQGLKYDPENSSIMVLLVEALFLQRDYGAAYQQSLRVLMLEKPPKEKALRITIHCALEAGLVKEALAHSIVYLQFHHDQTIIEVVDRIRRNDNVTELSRLFTAPDP